MVSEYSFICVDLQNEFATKGGKFYTPKPSVQFLESTLFPFLERKRIKVNEIISDYRQPRPGDRGDGCHPGEWGYQSLLPDVLRGSLWVKCMNSPVWVRDGIGDPKKDPGLPFPSPENFSRWFLENVGEPGAVVPILFGLTIDCCVLSTAQGLNWRGYRPVVLKEGVDHASGKPEDKEQVLRTPVSNWAKVIGWSELATLLAETQSPVVK